MIRRPHVVRTSSGVHVQLFVKRQPRGPATTTPGTNVGILSRVYSFPEWIKQV